MKVLFIATLITIPYLIWTEVEIKSDNERKAQKFLRDANRLLTQTSHKISLLLWDFSTNITDENEIKLVSL